MSTTYQRYQEVNNKYSIDYAYDKDKGYIECLYVHIAIATQFVNHTKLMECSMRMKHLFMFEVFGSDIYFQMFK